MQPTLLDEATKDNVRQQWNAMAQGWSDSSAIIRPWLRDATQAMLTMAGIKPGAHVLDVAAGAGDQTIDIAERVGAAGSVLATDLSPEILRYAERNVAQAGYRNVETRVSDGEHLGVDDASFDAVVCRLGLMLFRDPLQGLRDMRRALRPGGGIWRPRNLRTTFSKISGCSGTDSAPSWSKKRLPAATNLLWQPKQ